MTATPIKTSLPPAPVADSGLEKITGGEASLLIRPGGDRDHPAAGPSFCRQGTVLYRYVPLGRFLAWMGDGWRMPLVAEPMAGPAGRYTCLMFKAAAAP